MLGVGVWKLLKSGQKRPHWSDFCVHDEKGRKQAKQVARKQASLSKYKDPEVEYAWWVKRLWKSAWVEVKGQRDSSRRWEKRGNKPLYVELYRLF